jgi:hypothetical protein
MNNLYLDSYGTHRPCLLELILNTNGNIIECGCGNSSTLLIKNIIKNTNRKLISLESNLEWLNKFKHLEDDNHKLFHVDAGNIDNDNTGKKWIDYIKNNDLINNLDFEVCFIDQSPWTARTYTLNYFKNKCPFIVVHDVDYFPVNNKWGKAVQIPVPNGLKVYDMNFSDILKNSKIYYPPLKYFASKTGPPTLIGSNTLTDNEFNKIINNINCDKYYN